MVKDSENAGGFRRVHTDVQDSSSDEDHVIEDALEMHRVINVDAVAGAGPETEHIPTKREHWKRPFQISYEYTFWAVFILGSVFVIQDRWTWNPVPWHVNNEPFEGHGSVVFFDFMARLSGRLTLMTNNVMYYTMCHAWANFVAQHAPKWVDMGDIRETHRKIHYHVGWLFLGIPMVIHVWSIIVPSFFGIRLELMKERPFGLPFFADGAVNLAHDDLYRLILMSIIWFIVLPLSLRDWLRNKSWTGATFLHLFGGLYFSADLIRKMSHPHSQAFNSPFVLMWVIDRIYSQWKYRKNRAEIVKVLRLDENYVALFLRTDHTYKRKIGDVYRLNFHGFTFHVPHPFTMWSNYRAMRPPKDYIVKPGFLGHKFSLRDLNEHIPNVEEDETPMEFVRHDTGEMKALEESGHLELPFSYRRHASYVDKSGKKPKQPVIDCGSSVSSFDHENICEQKWDTGAIVQVMRMNPEECCSNKTFTQKLSRTPPPFINAYGPFRSAYQRLYDIPNLPPLVLIASGAGGGILLDFHAYIVANNIELKNPVQIYYSTRSITLFQFMTDMICEKRIPNLWVNAHITSQDGKVSYKPKDNKERDMAIGRAAFKDILRDAPEDAEVLFCGSPGLQKRIQKLCKKYKLRFKKGHSFHTE